MARAVGIDLGTTNSCVAVMEGGRPVVVANAEGMRTTPSVVAYPESGDRLVGAVAKRQAVLHPKSTLYSAKRFMGRKLGEVAAERAAVPYSVVAGPNDAVRFEIRGRTIAPEEVGAQVLRKLVEDAGKYLGEKITHAVITVPAYFNDAQRQATRDAGRIAGLEVARIVNEPTAAALAYGLDRGEPERIMVFDLGGGTFDVSILDIGEGVCEVRATSGDTHLGGDDFDRVLVEWLADEFKKREGVDLRKDPQALQRLQEAAERAKCELSTSTTATIHLPFVTATSTGPKHLETTLTRAQLERLVGSLVERCRAPVERALRDAKLSAGELDEVLLVGGSTRMPLVQELVRKLAGGREPNMGVNPDEVVAVGAAVQAGILAGEVENVVLLDVIPLSLGLETMGGVMTRLIERNTTIPCRRSQVFSTAEDDQPSVDITVLQGEREMAKDNRTVGQFRLEGIRPAARGLPKIEVTFDVDANGILDVTAKDQDTGKEQAVKISGSTALEKPEIDRMVKDAVDHAEEDKRRRAEVEDRNRADAVAYRVEHALRESGERIPAHQAERARSLVEELRQALKEERPVAEVQRLRGDLEQCLHGFGIREPEGAAGSAAGAPGSRSGDDYIDAEFTTE